MHLPKKKKAFLNWTLWCSGVQPAVLLSQDQSGGAAPPSRLKLYGDLSGPVSICGPEPRSRNTWGISGESLPRRKLLRSSRISMYLYFLPFFFFFYTLWKDFFRPFLWSSCLLNRSVAEFYWASCPNVQSSKWNNVLHPFPLILQWHKRLFLGRC